MFHGGDHDLQSGSDATRGADTPARPEMPSLGMAAASCYAAVRTPRVTKMDSNSVVPSVLPG
jgi:hypothetical protein